MLYNTILYYTILYYTISYYRPTIFYYTIFGYPLLYYTILYNTIHIFYINVNVGFAESSNMNMKRGLYWEIKLKVNTLKMPVICLLFTHYSGSKLQLVCKLWSYLQPLDFFFFFKNRSQFSMYLVFKSIALLLQSLHISQIVIIKHIYTFMCLLIFTSLVDLHSRHRDATSDTNISATSRKSLLS